MAEKLSYTQRNIALFELATGLEQMKKNIENDLAIIAANSDTVAIQQAALDKATLETANAQQRIGISKATINGLEAKYAAVAADVDADAKADPINVALQVQQAEQLKVFEDIAAAVASADAVDPGVVVP